MLFSSEPSLRPLKTWICSYREGLFQLQTCMSHPIHSVVSKGPADLPAGSSRITLPISLVCPTVGTILIHIYF